MHYIIWLLLAIFCLSPVLVSAAISNNEKKYEEQKYVKEGGSKS